MSVKRLFLPLLSAVLMLSCSVDIMGIFISSYVNDRFQDSVGLQQPQPPAIADPSDFSFLIITDPHYVDTSLPFVDSLIAAGYYNADFIVLAGDIVQDGRKEAYSAAVSDLSRISIPLYTIIGNHDIYFGGYEKYREYFGPTVYSFLIEDNLFIFLDSANGTLGTDQRQWLEDQLKRTDYSKSFLFSHYGILSSGFQKFVEWSLVEEKYELIDLFDQYNVNYFFSGHLHFTESLTVRQVNYRTIANIMNPDDPTALLVRIQNNMITDTFLTVP